MTFRSRFALLRRVSILDLATIAVLGFALVLLFKPSAAMGSWLNNWKLERELATKIENNWDALAAAASRLYTESADPEVIEFLDYQCPFCRAGSSSVDSAVAAGVRVGVIHLPLPIHPPATGAALAALCAEKAGVFQDVHSALLQSSAWYDVPADSAVGALVGLTSHPAAANCISGGGLEVGLALQTHVSLASELGVSSTPFFVAKSGTLRGLPSAQSLIDLVHQR